MMNRFTGSAHILIMFLLMSFIVHAQETPNADSLFLKAREAAFNDRWAEARIICRQLLSHYPNYHDATMLIGSTYAWELKADSARMTVSPLLNIEPDGYDILNLLADNEIWSGNYDDGIQFIDKALIYYPLDEDFLYKKANAYYLKNDFYNSTQTLNELFSVNPNHEQGKELQRAIHLPQLARLYDSAEENTRAGNWDEAHKYIQQMLAQDPDHFPTLLLLGSVYAFENKFDSARHVTTRLYKNNHDNYELLDLMVNIEIWDNKYKDAMTQVNRALRTFPDDPEFLFKKAFIQYLQKEYREALKTLDHLLSDEIDPKHADGIKLRNDILQNHRYKDYILHEYYYEYHNKPNSHKWITSTGLAKWTKYGTYIGKLNIGHDWGRKELPHRPLPAYQLELEAYQGLWRTNYLWLNHAFALDTSGFFPRHRGGIEFFQRLPQGLEASIGLRYMYWSSLLVFYTGSLSWVSNLNYWSYRLFVNPAYPLGFTNIITYRRYFSQRPEYFYVLAGYGTYSDEFLHLIEGTPAYSWIVQTGIHKFITQRWFFLASVGYARDDGYRNRIMAQAGVRYYFNMFK